MKLPLTRPSLDWIYHSTMKDFHRRFRQARRKARLTQDDIASVCLRPDGESINRAAVAQWEKEGGGYPTLPNAVAACRLMGVSLDYLTGLSDEDGQAPIEALLNAMDDVDALIAKYRLSPSPEARKQAIVFEYEENRAQRRVDEKTLKNVILLEKFR